MNIKVNGFFVKIHKPDSWKNARFTKKIDKKTMAISFKKVPP